MLRLKNNFIFAPVKLGFSDESGRVTEKHIDFYGARSRYLGAVTVEPFYLNKGLREIPTQIGIDNDNKIAGLKRLVDSIHKFDTKVIAHLNHPGRMANPNIPGNYFISSTDRPCENGGAIPKRMDRKDMDKVITLYVEAAKRAEKVGFDLIELQFGHGYLLAQFISPAVNDRTDEYGGSFDNRIRFPLEILKAVIDAIALPVIVRISGDEMIPGGIKLPEMVALSKILEKEGVEAIHVSAGTVCSTPAWYFQHMFVPKGKTWEMAREIKEEVNIPVIFVGRVDSEKDIEILKKEYDADYIAIGRGLVADPELVGKYLKLVKGDIRPCLACSEGCLGGVKSGKGIQCVVNPTVGNDLETIEPAEKRKTYAVVGGGLAGIESALILRKRGHKVVLYEKNELGGQFNLAYLPPDKDSLKKLIDYYVVEMEKAGIEIIFKEATKEDIISRNYDGVILATGSEPVIPPIEGLKEYHWAEILFDENLPENKNVLIIGGGLIGVEIAHKLMKKGNRVIIVEMLGEIARGMETIEKAMTLKDLKNGDVKIYMNSKVSKVEGHKVYVEGEHNEVFENIDMIVVATGMRSYNPLKEKLDGKIPTYTVGDAKKVGKAKDAIKDSYETTKGL